MSTWSSGRRLIRLPTTCSGCWMRRPPPTLRRMTWCRTRLRAPRAQRLPRRPRPTYRYPRLTSATSNLLGSTERAPLRATRTWAARGSVRERLVSASPSDRWHGWMHRACGYSRFGGGRRRRGRAGRSAANIEDSPASAAWDPAVKMLLLPQWEPRVSPRGRYLRHWEPWLSPRGSWLYQGEPWFSPRGCWPHHSEP